MKIGAVILCRFSSSRLPGKILKDLSGHPALYHTYTKLLDIFTKDQIVVATSDQSSDDPIEAYCSEHGIPCFRGSLYNVYQRFIDAADFMSFDWAARVNGDNIFIDTDLFRSILKLTANEGINFISNVKNRTFPKGMSIECVRISYFKSLQTEVYESDEYQEHVTLILYQRESKTHKFIFNDTIEGISGINLALDTKDDFNRITGMIKYLGDIYPNYNIHHIKEAYEYMEG